MAFRGSITRRWIWLSTLCSGSCPLATQDSLPAAGPALSDGIGYPQDSRRKVSGLRLFAFPELVGAMDGLLRFVASRSPGPGLHAAKLGLTVMWGWQGRGTFLPLPTAYDWYPDRRALRLVRCINAMNGHLGHASLGSFVSGILLSEMKGRAVESMTTFDSTKESLLDLLQTTAKNEARTEQGCFVSFCSAFSKTWRPTGTPRRSIRCPTAGQPTPTSDSGNLTCWIGIAPLAAHDAYLRSSLSPFLHS